MENRSGGFSLVEILVAISLIITSTTVVVAILTSAFRASSKTTSADVVRQNGNNAINRVSRMIQYSDGFNGVSNDGTTYILTCPTTPTRYNFVKVTSVGQPRVVSCSDSGVAIDSVSLLSSAVRITPGSCILTCSQDSAAISPVIGISFDLQLGNATVSEKTARINFATSVKMRNFE